MSEKSNLGMGVMINMLAGYDSKTKEAIASCIGQTIRSVIMKEGESGPDTITLVLDNCNLILWDDGQSCCEHRYMHTDDEINRIKGQELRDIKLEDGPDEEMSYDVKESQFLHIVTDKDQITIVNYNEHNGYYGGFSLRAAVHEHNKMVKS